MTLQHSENEDKTIYKVVMNEEEQYSIWPEYRENPRGWGDAGKVGDKTQCLAYVKEVWTDMRPLSLRKKMEELARNPPTQEPSAVSAPRNEVSLVDRLCAGDHPLELTLRPEPTVQLFKEAVDNGYLRLKFTSTRPGTELGFRLDKDSCNFGDANFEEGKGSAHLVGDLSLDFTKVRCIANIDLERLAGQGHLEKVEALADLG